MASWTESGIGGNLELRLPNRTITSSVPIDGHEVYKAIRELALLYDACQDKNTHPTEQALIERLGPQSRVIFSQKPSDVYNPEALCEVIIDPTRRILMHTADEDSYKLISPDFKYTAKGALDALNGEHQFQIIKFHPKVVYARGSEIFLTL